MLFFFRATWWLDAATAAQRGGARTLQYRPTPPGGEIPRSSDPAEATIVIKESRSLYSCEHLNSRPPEASAAHPID